MITENNLEKVFLESKILKKILEFYTKNSFPNLIILSGPNKILKKFLIFRLIKFHLCLDPKDSKSCNRCKSCILFENGEHPDLIIFPEDKIKIGDAKEPEIYTIRWLQREKLIFKPFISPYRFIVFLSSDLLGNEAEVALLKTLEEPSENTKFVFFTPSLDLLRETIISRGVVIQFPYFSFEQTKLLINKEDEFIEILGGSIDNYNENLYELYKELKSRIEYALEHPLELLNLEKWVNENSTKYQEVEQNAFYEMFSLVLIQKLKKKGHYSLIDIVARFLTGLRAEQSGLLSYLTSKLFFELYYKLFKQN